MLLDPEISDRVYLAVVQGDMRNYLKNQLLQKQEQIDFYLYKMLSHYEKQKELTIANLHQFMEKMYDPYADPVIPFFSVSKDEIVYQGTALFKDEVMKCCSEKQVYRKRFRFRPWTPPWAKCTLPAVSVSTTRSAKHKLKSNSGGGWKNTEAIGTSTIRRKRQLGFGEWSARSKRRWND
jgi:hypothetical protein